MDTSGYPKEITLPTGVKALIMPVSASLISEVTGSVKTPVVPIWHNEDKGRDEPNPSDPAYMEALEDMERERGMAAIDAMIMFGVELVDGLPQDDGWLKKLKYLEKRGRLVLEGYDLNDSMDLEFLYKRYIAVDSSVLEMITEASGVSPEEIDLAESSFPGS